MDLFKRQLAPLTSEAWEEINERAKQVLKSYLSARKVVSVVGPKGWEYSFVPEGRVKILEKEGEVGVGLRKAKPLLEVRVPFRLVRWEMDDIERGAKDSDLGPLEEAAKQIALFEENVIYNGYEKATVKGIVESVGKQTDSSGFKAERNHRITFKGCSGFEGQFRGWTVRSHRQSRNNGDSQFSCFRIPACEANRVLPRHGYCCKQSCEGRTASSEGS
ncbi:hypothetical protein PHOSAC3_120259 [Mesotoga infera]|nr:hypothetical protein PHOSAC3_120259 [Mesotoga infera]